MAKQTQFICDHVGGHGSKYGSHIPPRTSDPVADEWYWAIECEPRSINIGLITKDTLEADYKHFCTWYCAAEWGEKVLNPPKPEPGDSEEAYKILEGVKP